MKKLFAILLAVAVVCALSVTAMATTITPVGEASKVVTGQYQAGSADVQAYKVAIVWGDMTFKYTDNTKTWNTTDLKWDESGAGWTVVNNSNTITLTNSSSEDIEATFTFTAAEGSGITGKFTNEAGADLANNKITVANALPAEGQTTGAAKTAVAKFVVTGGTLSANADLGTISVVIENVPAADPS